MLAPTPCVRKKESLPPPAPRLHHEHWPHIQSYIFINYFSAQASQSLTMYVPIVSCPDVGHSFYPLSWSSFPCKELES